MINKRGPFHLFSRLAAILVCSSLLMGQSGCVSSLPHPLSEDVRSGLGTVGIVSASFVTAGDLSAYSKSREGGAVRGGTEGAAAGALGGAALLAELSASTGFSAVALAGAPVIGPALVVLVGATVLVGAGLGASKAIPKETVIKIEEMLNRALSELRLAETVQHHIVRTASSQANRTVVVIEGQGPATLEEAADYRSQSEKGVDTVLEASILSVQFDGKGGKDPLLSFKMTLRARLIRTADGTVLYEHALEYRSAKRKFSQWTKDNAKPFIDELDSAYQGLAEKVTEEIFLVYDLS
jgi:hypothetical protein